MIRRFPFSHLTPALVIVAVFATGLHGENRFSIDLTAVAGEVDYVDFGQVERLPARAGFEDASRAGNLASFAVRYRAWSILGEFVYNPEFYYALNPEFLVGKERRVDFQTIAKYPDLVKRYQSIRPTSVNYTITLDVRSGAFDMPVATSFKVTDNDLVYFGSRSGRNYASPTSPMRWSEVVSVRAVHPQFVTGFGGNVTIRNEEADIKRLLLGYRSFDPLPSGAVDITLNIRWPEEAIDRIGELYEQYEREGREIAAEFAYLEEAEELAPYRAEDEWAEPHEVALKPGDAFRDDGGVGIKVDGRVVLRSTEHTYASAVDEENRYFFLNIRNGLGAHLYDTRGKRLNVGGYGQFRQAERSGRGNLQLIGVPDHPPVAFQTTRKHNIFGNGLPGTLTPEELESLKRRDARGSDGWGFWHYGRYYAGELLEVDEKMRVLSRAPIYFGGAVYD